MRWSDRKKLVISSIREPIKLEAACGKVFSSQSFTSNVVISALLQFPVGLYMLPPLVMNAKVNGRKQERAEGEGEMRWLETISPALLRCRCVRPLSE